MPASAGAYVKTARLPDDDFVNVWAIDQVLYYDVVSLCVPGSAVCGDGTIDTLCERCDDGPANSDTTQDACRTDCERAHCGDGVVDAGEGCDDGNTVDCDGCSGACVPEPGLGCGDGVPFPACGEACDDGNAIEGDGCASCTLERGLGGGAVGTDCFTAWSIDNPANEPRYAKSGAFSDSQVCTDNDARCDFDGGIAGSCTFHVRVCVNNTHLAGCVPGTRLSEWDLRAPSVKSALSRPAAAAVRDALMSVVPAGVVGTSLHDLCSPNAEVPVPLRGAPGSYKKARVTLKTRATLYDGRSDTDKLRLECRP
jgi:cysteine-rich repeat protein